MYEVLNGYSNSAEGSLCKESSIVSISPTGTSVSSIQRWIYTIIVTPEPACLMRKDEHYGNMRSLRTRGDGKGLVGQDACHVSHIDASKVAMWPQR